MMLENRIKFKWY